MVRAFIFIVHRVQHSHCSALFSLRPTRPKPPGLIENGKQAHEKKLNSVDVEMFEENRTKRSSSLNPETKLRA